MAWNKPRMERRADRLAKRKAIERAEYERLRKLYEVTE